MVLWELMTDTPRENPFIGTKLLLLPSRWHHPEPPPPCPWPCSQIMRNCALHRLCRHAGLPLRPAVGERGSTAVMPRRTAPVQRNHVSVLDLDTG